MLKFQPHWGKLADVSIVVLFIGNHIMDHIFYKFFITVFFITPPMLTGRLSLLSRLNIAGPKPG